MSLIHTATADNRQLLEGRSVTYSVAKVQQEYTQTTGNVTTTTWFVYEYRRFCTCQYKYVGMDYQSALQKQDQLIQYYTRSTLISDWNPFTGDFARIDGGKKLMTQVQVIKNVGHLYDVVVSVNEEDCILKKSGSFSTAALFATENQRQYEV